MLVASKISADAILYFFNLHGYWLCGDAQICVFPEVEYWQ